MISKITFNKISKNKISRPPRVREIVITHPYSTINPKVIMH